MTKHDREALKEAILSGQVSAKQIWAHYLAGEYTPEEKRNTKIESHETESIENKKE